LSNVYIDMSSTTRKIAIGIGLAGGALLAAYLFSGNRKKKTQEIISKTGKKLREAMDTTRKRTDNSPEADYV